MKLPNLPSSFVKRKKKRRRTQEQERKSPSLPNMQDLSWNVEPKEEVESEFETQETSVESSHEDVIETPDSLEKDEELFDEDKLLAEQAERMLNEDEDEQEKYETRRGLDEDLLDETETKEVIETKDAHDIEEDIKETDEDADKDETIAEDEDKSEAEIMAEYEASLASLEKEIASDSKNENESQQNEVVDEEYEAYLSILENEEAQEELDPNNENHKAYLEALNEIEESESIDDKDFTKVDENTSIPDDFEEKNEDEEIEDEDLSDEEIESSAEDMQEDFEGDLLPGLSSKNLDEEVEQDILPGVSSEKKKGFNFKGLIENFKNKLSSIKDGVKSKPAKKSKKKKPKVNKRPRRIKQEKVKGKTQEIVIRVAIYLVIAIVSLIVVLFIINKIRAQYVPINEIVEIVDEENIHVEFSEFSEEQGVITLTAENKGDISASFFFDVEFEPRNDDGSYQCSSDIILLETGESTQESLTCDEELPEEEFKVTIDLVETN